MAQAKSDELPKKRLSFQELKQATFFLKYLKPYAWKFFFGMVFLLLSSVTSMVFPWIIGQVMDAATATDNQFSNSLQSLAWQLLGILLLQAFFSFFRIIWFSQISENAMANIRTDIYAHLIHLPIDFFYKNRVGEFNSRLSSDITQIQDTFLMTFPEFLRGILNLIVGIGIILWISPTLTLVMISTFPILIIVAIVFGKYIRKLSKETQAQLAEASVVVEETLQGILNVKTFANELFEINRYKLALAKGVQLAIRGSWYRAAFASFIIFALFGSIVLVIGFGASLVQSKIITVGELTQFVIYTVFVGAAIGGFSEHFAQIQKMLGATERVREILDEKIEHQSVKKEHIKLNGKLSFKNVSFHYPSRPELEVLKNINFDLEKGKRIALVGGSGAGKSTLASLVFRLYDPQQGEIQVDDKSFLDYSLQDLRSNMALVPQDILLFGGTILENIAYGNLNASREEIEQAAKKAYAHDFILSFPQAYDTIVGERGVKLSGGQRQRIAIARAILKDPAILVLDEATSALDAESELWVQKALDELMKGRTTLVIAHRLSTIKNADTILVMKSGEIAESGTHSELMDISDGIYKNLVSLQSLEKELVN